jgi:hypothetical protein
LRLGDGRHAALTNKDFGQTLEAHFKDRRFPIAAAAGKSPLLGGFALHENFSELFVRLLAAHLRTGDLRLAAATWKSPLLGDFAFHDNFS